MQEKNTLQVISFYIGILLLVGLFVLIYLQESVTNLIIEMTGEYQIQESKASIAETTNLLLSLDKISFDTSVLSLPYLQDLTQFPSYPIDAETLSNFGKTNPFIGSFIVVTNQASTSTGGVVYSTQRTLNNGSAVRAVPATRR